MRLVDSSDSCNPFNWIADYCFAQAPVSPVTPGWSQRHASCFCAAYDNVAYDCASQAPISPVPACSGVQSSDPGTYGGIAQHRATYHSTPQAPVSPFHQVPIGLTDGKKPTA